MILILLLCHVVNYPLFQSIPNPLKNLGEEFLTNTYLPSSFALDWLSKSSKN